MKITDVLLLLAAGTLGGIFSTVVSVASLVTYPVLLALGVPPLSANMTNTVSLVLTGAGSVAGSRPELAGQGRRVLRFGAITALGGAAGATVLLTAPAGSFALVVPVLIAGASLALLVQPAIKKRTERAVGAEPAEGAEETESAEGAEASAGPPGLARRAALFAVAMYVGYFGAAAGIMLLVVLSGLIDEPLVRVNAIKNAVSGAANAMAAVCFALFGDVRWKLVIPLAAGFLIGGWIGPAIARRVPVQAFRVVVAVCGLGLATRLGLSAYH
jgi:uncharacterized membrane protein YfcA